jgi:hypothetical protein
LELEEDVGVADEEGALHHCPEDPGIPRHGVVVRVQRQKVALGGPEKNVIKKCTYFSKILEKQFLIYSKFDKPNGGSADADEDGGAVEQDVVGVDKLRDEEGVRDGAEKLFRKK